MKKTLFFLATILLISGCATPNETIQVKNLVQTTKSWDSSTLPAYPKGIPEITILRIVIPGKTKLPLHKHPVINAGVLLSGELDVITENNEKLHLKAGDPIVEVVDKWHYGENKGNEPAEIIVFYAGEKGKSITVKE